jgi:hypothetical protein
MSRRHRRGARDPFNAIIQVLRELARLGAFRGAPPFLTGEERTGPVESIFMPVI